MKKASKYDNMFDKMREVLIEYATAKDEQGRWLHKTPEIMRKFGFGDDPKVIDGFNRWLNRQGIYRCPKPKRSEPIPETLFPAEEIPTKEEEPVKAEQVRIRERNAHIINALRGAYDSFINLLTLIEKDDENFQVWRFLSWSKNNGGETATALCNSNGWFLQAINCMRDGDMGHVGEDGVYDRIWWTDSVDSWDEPRAATVDEVAKWESHCDHNLDDPAWLYVRTIFLNEGPVAIYMRINE